MRKLKYIKHLERFRNEPFFTTKELKHHGVPRHALVYLEKRGDIESVYPGAYRFAEYVPQVEFQWENLSLMAASVEGSVICLISALVYYDLTDQIMREAWLAIPHQSHAPKRAGTRIVRMRNTSLGKMSVCMGEYQLQIFDRERCIVDAFRYLSKEIAIKALKNYFQSVQIKPDIKKLNMYATKLRINITPYILCFTT